MDLTFPGWGVVLLLDLLDERGSVVDVPNDGDIDAAVVESEDGRVGVLMGGMRVEELMEGERTLGDCLGSLNLNSKAEKAFSSLPFSRFRCVCEVSAVALRVRPEGGCIGDLLGGETFGGERVGGDCLRGAPLSPPTGCSFRVAKLRGLRPRTMMELDLASATAIFAPVVRVAINLILSVKCCCSSRRRPLFAVATRNCILFHAMGKVANSASMSWLDMMSSGIEAGSGSSPLESDTGTLLTIDVFQGITISLTGPPSFDSVAEICSSCPIIGIRSPVSVRIYRRLRGIVIEPDIE